MMMIIVKADIACFCPWFSKHNEGQSFGLVVSAFEKHLLWGTPWSPFWSVASSAPQSSLSSSPIWKLCPLISHAVVVQNKLFKELLLQACLLLEVLNGHLHVYGRLFHDYLKDWAESLTKTTSACSKGNKTVGQVYYFVIGKLPAKLRVLLSLRWYLYGFYSWDLMHSCARSIKRVVWLETKIESLSRYVLLCWHQNVLGLWGPFKKGIPSSGASELKEGYKNRHDDISCKG